MSLLGRLGRAVKNLQLRLQGRDPHSEPLVPERQVSGRPKRAGDYIDAVLALVRHLPDPKPRAPRVKRRPALDGTPRRAGRRIVAWVPAGKHRGDRLCPECHRRARWLRVRFSPGRPKTKALVCGCGVAR